MSYRTTTVEGGGSSNKDRKQSLDERLAALTARMQREEEEERRRVARQEADSIGSKNKDSDSDSGISQPSTQYKKFVNSSGGQHSSDSDQSTSADTRTSAGKYQEFVDTPGSPPPDKSVSPQPSTMARRLREYRSRFKVKPKPQTPGSTSVQNEKLQPSSIPVASPSPSQRCSPSPMPDLVSFHHPPPPLPQMWQCKICYNRVPSEALFQMHLTTTHFRERIMRRLPRTAPFACLLCQYTPPSVMTDVEKLEDLLMHYGTAERVAAKFYEEVCSDMEEQGKVEDKANTVTVSRVDCRICDLSLDNDKSLLKHLTLRHFPKLLCDDLPKRYPFRCPYIDCSQVRTSLHSLMLHYGVDHQVSMEIYQKQKDGKVTSDSFVCSGCTLKPSFTTELLYKQHIILTHLYPKISTSGPLNCPKCNARVHSRSEFTTHFLSNHHDDITLQNKFSNPPPPRQHLPTPTPPPSRPQCAVVTPYHPESDQNMVEEVTSPQQQETNNRVMRTVHSSRVARAKVMKSWGDSSLDAQKVKIGELETQIKDMENEYQAKLKDKQTEFERWIVMKEVTIEEEIKKRKSVEERLDEEIKKSKSVEERLKEFETSQSKKKDAEEKLIIQNKTTAVLQKTLSQKIVENNQLTKEVKDAERKFESKCEELQSFQSKLQMKESEFEALTKRYESKVSEVNDLQIIIQDRDDSLSDIQCELKKTEANLSKIDKSHEKAILSLKSKTEKLQKQLEDKQEFSIKSEAENLKVECEKLRDENALLSSKMEELEHQLQESQERNNTSKTLDKEKRELNKKVKQLSSTLADWESRQFTNLKLISGLEKERDSLQVKLKETQDGKLSHEDQLYWKNVEIKSRGKEIKSLNEKLDEKSAELEEHKNLLKSTEAEIVVLKDKVDAFEKNVVSGEEDDIKKSQELTNENTNLKNEIMHLKMSLNQKKTDLSTLKSTALCQKTELDRLLAENEKFESDYSQAVAQLETLKNTNEEIEGKNKLKDEELRCLKNKLSKSIDKEKVAAMLRAQNDAFHEKDSQQIAEDYEVSDLEKLNQVDTDVNKDLKIETIKSCANNVVIKEEPEEEDDYEPGVCEFGLKNFIDKTEKSIIKEESGNGPGCLNMNDSQIVLNINDVDILGKIKMEPQTEEEETEPIVDTTNHITIAPWPAFVPLASHPELSTEMGKKRHSDASTNGKSNAKKSKSTLEDVTDQYKDQDSDEEVLCGICNHYDPPLSPENATGQTYTTEWVGCDCDRWFHKPCTKMKRFSDKFSCKSVKMKCLAGSSN